MGTRFSFTLGGIGPSPYVPVSRVLGPGFWCFPGTLSQEALPCWLLGPLSVHRVFEVSLAGYVPVVGLPHLWSQVWRSHLPWLSGGFPGALSQEPPLIMFGVSGSPPFWVLILLVGWAV